MHSKWQKIKHVNPSKGMWKTHSYRDLFVYWKWQQCGAHLIDVKRTFWASPQSRWLTGRAGTGRQRVGTETSLYIFIYMCACVFVLRVQLNPVAGTALIQMNSTLCANLKSICKLQFFRVFSSFFTSFQFCCLLNATFSLAWVYFECQKKSVSNGKKFEETLCLKWIKKDSI